MGKAISIYLSETVAKKGKAKARTKKFHSFSEYVSDLIRKDVVPDLEWPPGYFDQVVGSWEGHFPEIEDLEVKEPEDLL